MSQDLAQKLDDIFSFAPQVSSTKDRITEYVDKVEAAEIVVKSNLIRTIEDKDYIVKKLKNVIDIGEKVLGVLETEISQGAQASRVEAFAYVLREVSLSIEKLQNLNKLILDISLMNEPINPVPQTQNNILVMDSKAALELVINATKEARNNSELNGIDLDFDNK